MSIIMTTKQGGRSSARQVNIEVNDIISATSVQPHRLTSFAQVDGLTITYPSDE